MARAEESRGLRDEANVGPDPRRARELRPMSDLSWKVADGEPDIRGWGVWASTGRELGVVHDLLVDTDAGEVVMLDVDLRRDDRHTLAPLRAAWIDRPTRRVVVDARELGAADALPALPRTGALSDADVSQFNDGYVRAYGDRGYDADQPYSLRRGDEELRFGAGRAAPKRLIDPQTAGTTAPDASRAMTEADAADAAGGAWLEESRNINRELADLPRAQAAHADTASTESPVPGTRSRSVAETRERDAEMARSVFDDAARRDAAAHVAEARVAAGAGDEERRSFDREHGDRDADLASLPDDGAIEPRELDARVRIEEGATVDDETPVGGVRYESDDYPRHDYGDLDDERARDALVNDARVVSRHPRGADVPSPADGLEGRVRYRPFDGPGQPGDTRA